jgi:excinuclease UvrABC ATPase subunit
LNKTSKVRGLLWELLLKYDFLRLLYARADAYSYNTGEKMVSSDEQIKDLIIDDFTGKRINILAPVIRARKDIMENCSSKSQTRF